ncbi:hypothetical protein ACWGJB_26565 [Streptomyces sp. NPDC054813]
MNAFAGTASYYRRFRPGIPAGLAALLAQEAPADSPRRLLDIGTGPGLVASALAPYFDVETALTEALVPFAEGGFLKEDNTFTVLTARRPSPMDR